MKLVKIDKVRYRKHLNIVIVACIISLALMSLGLSQLLIALFPDESGSHFHWNLTGVIVAAIALGIVLKSYREHEFMTEVVYVWELKKSLNKINRKIMVLEKQAKQGNPSALLALHYCYAGSRLLWELDDNSIVMDELTVKQAEVDALAREYQLNLNANDYDEALLSAF